MDGLVGGWVINWVSGWMEVKTVLSIVYSNQKMGSQMVILLNIFSPAKVVVLDVALFKLKFTTVARAPGILSRIVPHMV